MDFVIVINCSYTSKYIQKFNSNIANLILTDKQNKKDI